MKRILILIPLIAAFFYSCAGEDKTCSESGCDTGKHCVVKTNKCVKDCTVEYCGEIGEICNSETKNCEESCMDSGCEAGYNCNETNNKCEQSCLQVQCKDGLHCNVMTKLCDVNCVEADCSTEDKEVCDPESHICVVKADNACTDATCNDGSHCNATTGHCVGGCAEVDCSDGDVCNPDTLRCLHECKVGICKGESFCNTESKLCESFVDYPAGSYGKEEGDIIKELEWTDTDGKLASLKKLHSMYEKTGFPRVIILVESAGWCDPCRQEAPALRDFYNNKRLLDGRERVAVIQTIVDDNRNDGVMSNPDEFAKSWKTQYEMEFSVVGDNGRFSSDNGFTNGLPILENYNASGSIPFNLIINAKTMKIEGLENGTDEALSALRAKFREIEKEIVCRPVTTCSFNDCYIDNFGSAKCSN